MANGLKPGGREDSAPNKITAVVKGNIDAVFGQVGGTENMVEGAKHNKPQFSRLYAKILATSIWASAGSGH